MTEVEHAGYRGLVLLLRPDSRVVDGQLFEVGENREWQLRRPCVAAKLIGGCRVALEIDARFLGLDEELALAADAERVIGCLGGIADLDLPLVDDVPVLERIALAVGEVPAECLEEWRDELAAGGLFVVGRTAITSALSGESVGEDSELLLEGRERCRGVSYVWGPPERRPAVGLYRMADDGKPPNRLSAVDR